MTEKKDDYGDGGSAFPLQSVTGEYCWGMTLRDYFAAKAMQGLVERLGLDYLINRANQKKDVASAAYAVADAMLDQRER